MTDRHMQEAIACSPCHRLGYCLNREDQSCAEGCECLGLIATALAAAEKRGREEEREACTKMIEDAMKTLRLPDEATYHDDWRPTAKNAAMGIAAAIRARKDEP